MYRIAPHCPEDPLYFVPKVVEPLKGTLFAEGSALDPRGCFIVHLRDRLYVWVGEKCLPGLKEAGLRAAELLGKYEQAPLAQEVLQGGARGWGCFNEMPHCLFLTSRVLLDWITCMYLIIK
jgi:hypothetical protein